ncbi:MAG: transcriptional repressor LexA [Arenicella sp.]|jgi:repressor LexA|nr:transcriptional repressor LexA [Arenicella sp.]HAU68812.1 repressor LexA [Gammaproteobacteria bacterium]
MSSWTDLQPLTKRQQEIFDFILESIGVNGAPPTRVEIADHFGFKSANAAEDHLKALDKKGHIELKAGTSRGILIHEQARNAWMLDQSDVELGQPNKEDVPNLAIIGDVAAGAPIFASQHVQQYVSVDQSLFADKADYLLKVRGDSMINIGIFEKDLLAIKRTDSARENEIVVARIDDDVTVKRFRRNNGSSVSLFAENDDYEPIEVDLQFQSFAIEGVVVGLIRQNF